MVRYKSLEELLEEIGLRESGGNYSAVNKYGYLGKYQLGEGVLNDTGYYKGKSPGNTQEWRGQFTGKDNVYSKEDFLKNQQAQENAMKQNMQKQWNYVKTYGYDKHINSTINGIEITPSGLLAGVHLTGVGGVGDYLNSRGQKKVQDGFNTNVEEYLRKFGGYDVSEITDPNYYAPKFGGTKSDMVGKILNRGNDVISGITNKIMPPSALTQKVLTKTMPPPPLSDEEWLKRIKRNRMGLN